MYSGSLKQNRTFRLNEGTQLSRGPDTCSESAKVED